MASSMRRNLLASTLLGAVTIVAQPALAQVSQPAEAAANVQDETAEQPATDVIVTGSRIARPDLTTASPVNVVGQAEIQFRQPASAEDLLRSLPAVRPNLGRGVNNGSDGSASIDLRGIGTNRTLVLLDGRRIVPFVT